jgi:hypothetical protein
VCDIYLHPPPGTAVICVDEKTGIQATYRRYPQRPPAPGRLARREFEYVRNGTVSIIAALEVATGQVIAEPIGRNDPATFTGFLHRLDQCTDPRLTIHLLWSGCMEYLSLRARLTANILWASASPIRALAVAATVGPWLALAGIAVARRRGGGRHNATGRTTP